MIAFQHIKLRFSNFSYEVNILDPFLTIHVMVCIYFFLSFYFHIFLLNCVVKSIIPIYFFYSSVKILQGFYLLRVLTAKGSVYSFFLS